MNIQNFTINKNKFKKEGDKQPDYKLSAKIDDKFIDIGGAWIKESQTTSSKYFSVKLAEGLSITGEVKPYEKKTQVTNNEDF